MTTDLPTSAVPSTTRRRRPATGAWRRPAVEAAVVVVVFAAVGAAAGVVWVELWEPPQGSVQDGTWRYASLAEIEGVFSATGLYVVIGALAGLLLGVVAAYACPASELVTLLAVAAGSVLAAYLTYQVGLARSPLDLRGFAPGLADGTGLPDSLEVSGRSPFVAWSIGALVGLATTYLVTGSAGAGLEATRPFDDTRRPTADG